MSNEKSREQTREDFYSADLVKQHIKGAGVPTTVGTFKAMVASGSKLDLDSADGAKLIKTLGFVTFSKHPQQINIMDKSSGKTIVSIET